eukprot:273747-Pleurochrysis_carterae.AAC.1
MLAASRPARARCTGSMIIVVSGKHKQQLCAPARPWHITPEVDGCGGEQGSRLSWCMSMIASKNWIVALALAWISTREERLARCSDEQRAREQHRTEVDNKATQPASRKNGVLVSNSTFSRAS